MLTINTNLTSLIVQRNLKHSTNAINQAIERLSTGNKINHASDNAANYSIATNYETKISSYNIASSNITGGLDLLATAQDTLSLMQNHASRLHALITQAHNGTYSDKSLAALNSEAAGIIAEINRLYSSAEFNGIKLFRSDKIPEMELPDWVYTLNDQLDTSQYHGFISNPETKSQAYVDSLTHVSDVSTSFDSNKEYQVSTKEDLKQLAELVNRNISTENIKFYMGADIDLEGETITPIANRSQNNNYQFKGTFDGNGHVIKNFKINSTNKNYQGLFGYANGNSAIKNLGIENAEVKGKAYTGLLIGKTDGTITNCYATGNVTGNDSTGGLVGNSSKSISYSYTNVSVNGNKYVGGLVGYATKQISYCFTKGSVNASNDYAGGLLGYTDGKVDNCYSNASVIGQSYTSGLIGRTVETVNTVYATGDVVGNTFTGGMLGTLKKTSGTLRVDKILSLGHVTANDKRGSLIGAVQNTSNGKTFSTVYITNGYVLEQELNKIGGTYTTQTGNAPVPYDMTEWLDNITYLHVPDPIGDTITLQVGIYGNKESSISFDTFLNCDLSYILENGLESSGAYDTINTFIQNLSMKATELGSVSNRLESALDSVNTDLMTSKASLSTLRDADIAKLSSKYVRYQILQQASATLLATANQSPNIALQLI